MAYEWKDHETHPDPISLMQPLQTFHTDERLEKSPMPGSVRFIKITDTVLVERIVNLNAIMMISKTDKGGWLVVLSNGVSIQTTDDVPRWIQDMTL